MLKLEDIQAGDLVEGLVPGRPVTVIATIWHGDHDVEVVFEDSDKGLDRTLLSRIDEERLSVAAAEDSWPLDGDGRLFKLASEARLIRDPGTILEEVTGTWTEWGRRSPSPWRSTPAPTASTPAPNA